MNILYYCWKELSSYDIIDTLEYITSLPDNDITYYNFTFDRTLKSYDTDPDFTFQLENILKDKAIDMIFTFNYFPIVSTSAQKYNIPYAAWVFDCPNLSLYSKTITNPCNHIYIFDRELCDIVRSLGAEHVHHMPLAVNNRRLSALLAPDPDNISYLYDVSFVGSLYDNNNFDKINYLPPYLKGYLNAIICAQQKIWGMHLVPDLLTDDTILSLNEYIKLEKDPLYSFSQKELYTNIIDQKITSLDRISYLDMASKLFKVDLFTGSNASLCPKCIDHGFISYENEMPIVFNRSRINLNISLRSITSGIPLRCLDIMGAGGFLLSNYQPELFEYFEPGVDFAYYESMEDMMLQIQYYLDNPDERKQIASNGLNKIRSNYDYDIKLRELFSTSSGK